MPSEHARSETRPRGEKLARREKLARYYHTIRYLKPVQIYARIWFRIYRPRPDRRPAPPLRARSGRWEDPARRTTSLIGPETFRFLNHTGSLPAAGGWNDPAQDRLWLYNLHYFDDLNASGASERTAWHEALIERWIRENPPGSGNGWDPYPISLRVVNWIKWSLEGNPLSEDARQSLAVQTRYLAGRLEWLHLANHLFANLKALIFAGLFFGGAEGDRWLRRGVRLLRRELREQILADGGHCERTPMYHSIILEDLIDLLNLARSCGDALPAEARPLERQCASLIPDMLRWLKTMCHPDGEIAFFNDAAIGIAPTPAEIAAYAQRLGFDTTWTSPDGMTHLPESGYIRLQLGPAVALLDVGELGPDYNLAHAHADTLSFELSLYGERALVNSGVSLYLSGPQRGWERSTAAHNTVVIDGQDSSEVWGAHRVARRARPLDLDLEESRGSDLIVRCCHDGYSRLNGSPVHCRTWRLSGSALEISDAIRGPCPTTEARLYLHPGIEVKSRSADGAEIMLLAREHLLKLTSNRRLVLRDSEYYPGFGLSMPNQSVLWAVDPTPAAIRVSWTSF